MAPVILELIKEAIDTAKVLITEAGDIVQNNQNLIRDIDQNNYNLACQCIDSYKQEIAIIEKQLENKDLSDEQVQKYLDKVSEINEKIKAFIFEWSKQANEEKTIQTSENKAIMLATLGIITGGIGLIPFGIKEAKKKK